MSSEKIDKMRGKSIFLSAGGQNRGRPRAIKRASASFGAEGVSRIARPVGGLCVALRIGAPHGCVHTTSALYSSATWKAARSRINSVK